MLEVLVVGEYFKKVGHKENKRVEYRESFLLHDDFELKALMVIQRMLLGGRLAKSQEGYLKWHTCEIVDIKSSRKKTIVLSREELKKLERQDLIEYAATHGLFFRGSKLGRVFDMRDEIFDKVSQEEGVKELADT